MLKEEDGSPTNQLFIFRHESRYYHANWKDPDNSFNIMSIKAPLDPTSLSLPLPLEGSIANCV
jgi:hypothetical protein